MGSIYIRFRARGSDTPQRSPLLERLITRASGARETPDWRTEAFRLLAPAAIRPPPIAVAALQRSTHETRGAWVCVATPLHLSAGMSDVRLQDGGILTFAAAEAGALVADFNRVFAGAAVRLAPSRAAMLAVFDAVLEVETHDPETLVGRDLYPAQPTGADGARLRRLMSEIELWLFDHPVNRARSARGLPAASGLWLWGGGITTAPVPDVQGFTAGSDPLFAAFGDEAGWPGGARSGVVVSAEVPGSPQWAAFEGAWLAPAAAALRTGAVRRLDICAADHRYSIGPGPHMRFWRRPRPWWESFGNVTGAANGE